MAAVVPTLFTTSVLATVLLFSKLTVLFHDDLLRTYHMCAAVQRHMFLGK